MCEYVCVLKPTLYISFYCNTFNSSVILSNTMSGMLTYWMPTNGTLLTWNTPVITKISRAGSNFIIKNLPSVLILIIADQLLNYSLCCSNKYNWYLTRFIRKLYILPYTFLITLFKICISMHEVYWIKSTPDKSIMKLGPE